MTSLKDCLNALRPAGSSGRLLLTLTRDRAYEGMVEALSNSRSLLKEPNVRFDGEWGIDNGGLKREAMTVAMRQLAEGPLFTGPSNKRLFYRSRVRK